MDRELKLEISPDVMARMVGDEIVLLDLRAGIYFGLNPVGTRVWSLVGEGRTLGEVFDVLVGEFDVAPPQLELDLQALVDDLLAQGLAKSPS
jgi:hypothetical protein